MKNNKSGRIFPLKSVFLLFLRYFSLAVLTTIVLSGCGSGGGGGGSSAASNSSGNSTTVVIGSSGGSTTLPDKTTVAVDDGVVKDGTQITIQTSPSPQVSLPAGTSTASPSVHIELPAGALQSNLQLGKGIAIEIPLGQAVTTAVSLSDVSDIFKTVGVRISNGTQVTWGWAKYEVKIAADGTKNAGAWVGSKYLESINAAGGAVADGVLAIDAVVQDVANCFQGPQLNKLYQVVPLMGGQTLSPEIYSGGNSLNFSTNLSTNLNKTPLVLVHGIQLLGLDTCTDAYKNTWATFIAHFYDDPDLSSKYQLFTYSYDTSLPIKDEISGEGSGRALAQSLPQITGSHKAVVVAHSMGGIVSRSAMVYDAAPIEKLITLGSPHHGTTLREIDEILVKAGIRNSVSNPNYAATALFAEGAWFMTLDVQGARQLDWDNFDNKILSCGFLADQTCNKFIKNLNNRDTNFSQYTLFAGSISDPLVKAVYDYLGFPDGAGDLVVPKVSALFQDYDSTKTPSYYDKNSLTNRTAAFPVSHSGLHDDPIWPTSNPNSVFAAVKNALLPPIATYTLNVNVSGSGSGTVSGTGISCPASCIQQYSSGGSVVLSAIEVVGSTFGGWSGCTTVSGAFCYVTMDANKTVTATFNAVSPPPNISTTNIANGGTGVAVNSAISVTFNEALDASTLNTSTFTLTGPSGLVAGTVAYNAATNTATFTPSAALAYSTTYTATITTGVKDLAGNPLASNYSWSFTTGAGSAPSVPTGISATAGNGQVTISWNAVSGVTYNLYMASASGVTKSTYSGLPDGMKHSGVTSPYVHTGLTNGTTYYFVVTAVNAYGESSESSQVSATPQVSPVVTGKLNDTGITASQCYQAGSYVLVACSSAGAMALNNAQDGMAGRDANAATNSNTDGKLGFSFASVTSGCVQDNVTGLMWEVKTTDGGLRDWTKTYTNYSAAYNPSNLYGTSTDASGFMTAVNASNLCGYSDWRLPTADELHSIVDYGVAYPGSTVDATWFPNTQAYVFWSASPYVGYSYYAWGVSFYYGDVYNSYRYNSGYVRLVRAGQSPTPPRYTVSADGQEATDNQTKLIWRRCAEGMVFSGGTCTGTASIFTHEAALQLAAAQASSTGIAWRLPNVKELSSIADKSLINPAIDPTAFPATPASLFWSASPYVNISSYAWYVNFNYGYVYGNSRLNSYYVRLVRAGQ